MAPAQSLRPRRYLYVGSDEAVYRWLHHRHHRPRHLPPHPRLLPVQCLQTALGLEAQRQHASDGQVRDGA